VNAVTSDKDIKFKQVIRGVFGVGGGGGGRTVTKDVVHGKVITPFHPLLDDVFGAKTTIGDADLNMVRVAEVLCILLAVSSAVRSNKALSCGRKVVRYFMVAVVSSFAVLAFFGCASSLVMDTSSSLRLSDQPSCVGQAGSYMIAPFRSVVHGAANLGEHWWAARRDNRQCRTEIINIIAGRNSGTGSYSNSSIKMACFHRRDVYPCRFADTCVFPQHTCSDAFFIEYYYTQNKPPQVNGSDMNTGEGSVLYNAKLRLMKADPTFDEKAIWIETTVGDSWAAGGYLTCAQYQNALQDTEPLPDLKELARKSRVAFARSLYVYFLTVIMATCGFGFVFMLSRFHIFNDACGGGRARRHEAELSRDLGGAAPHDSAPPRRVGQISEYTLFSDTNKRIFEQTIVEGGQFESLRGTGAYERDIPREVASAWASASKVFGTGGYLATGARMLHRLHEQEGLHSVAWPGFVFEHLALLIMPSTYNKDLLNNQGRKRRGGAKGSFTRLARASRCVGNCIVSGVQLYLDAVDAAFGLTHLGVADAEGGSFAGDIYFMLTEIHWFEAVKAGANLDQMHAVLLRVVDLAVTSGEVAAVGTFAPSYFLDLTMIKGNPLKLYVFKAREAALSDGNSLPVAIKWATGEQH